MTKVRERGGGGQLPREAFSRIDFIDVAAGAPLCLWSLARESGSFDQSLRRRRTRGMRLYLDEGWWY